MVLSTFLWDYVEKDLIEQKKEIVNLVAEEHDNGYNKLVKLYKCYKILKQIQINSNQYFNVMKLNIYYNNINTTYRANQREFATIKTLTVFTTVRFILLICLSTGR